MAAYETGNPLQRTVELQHGEHAYFFDRWWQQRADRSSTSSACFRARRAT